MFASFLWSTPYYVPDPQSISDETKWNLIRSHRNGLLSRCDWTQLPDAPLVMGEREMWATYRQTLRDLPELFETPDEVIFPTPPEGDA